MGARKPTYEVLAVEPFGEHLLASLDLDPVYVALHRAQLEEPVLHRWLLAYWCFYHCGVASWLAEREGWEGFLEAARNTTSPPVEEGRWPRGKERRHFRGETCVRAVEELQGRYPDPGDVVPHLLPPGGTEVKYQALAHRVQKLPLFGPWIAFKVADMLERLELARVSFDEAAVFMFKDPAEAAMMLWRERSPWGQQPGVHPKREVIIHEIVGHLTAHFAGQRAPPRGERPVGLQEVETILCKWKSHVRGHYPLDNDIREIRHGLTPWARKSAVAGLLLENMPCATMCS